MTGDIVGIVEAARSLKPILDCIPGSVDIVRDTVGMYIGDKLKAERQRRNLERMARLTEEKIEGKVIDENMSQTVAEEILNAAKNEDREELQQLWVALLAKLATGNFNAIRIDFFDIIKKFAPIDAVTLSHFSRCPGAYGGYISGIEYHSLINTICQEADVEVEDVHLSIQALVRLECLQRNPGDGRGLTLTLMGKKIFEAVQTD